MKQRRPKRCPTCGTYLPRFEVGEEFRSKYGGNHYIVRDILQGAPAYLDEEDAAGCWRESEMRKVRERGPRRRSK